jgi:hypothetical protein
MAAEARAINQSSSQRAERNSAAVVTPTDPTAVGLVTDQAPFAAGVYTVRSLGPHPSTTKGVILPSHSLSHSGRSFAGLVAGAGWTPFSRRACGLVGRARIGVPRKMVELRSSEVKGSPGPPEKRGLHPASMRLTDAGFRGMAEREPGRNRRPRCWRRWLPDRRAGPCPRRRVSRQPRRFTQPRGSPRSAGPPRCCRSRRFRRRARSGSRPRTRP